LGTGATLEHGSDVGSGTFMVDMNRVFEEFVARWFRENLRPPFCAVSQSKHALDTRRQMDIKPDLLIYRADDFVAVFDTKYKLRRSGAPTNDDVYQAVAYADRFGLADAWLLFADDDTRCRHTSIINRETTVISVGLGLARSWADITGVLEVVRDRVVASAQR
jgi:5-methylcytosine-specific restriction endonuclease McrBC regulatory subunit McrC